MCKISIIIPTRNRQHLLERAISNSFIHKNVAFEVIISDNCSSDCTWDKLKTYKEKYKKLKIVKQNELIDLADHWDNVVRYHSKGKYILVLCDDDIIIDENYLKDACDILDKQEKVSTVFARYNEVNEKDKIIGEYETKWPNLIQGSEMLRKYSSGKDLFIPFLTGVFRRTDYEKVAGFQSPALSPELGLWLKFTAIGDFAFIDRKVANYMIHQTNISNSLDPMLQILDIKMINLVKIYFSSISKLNSHEKKHLNRLSRFTLRRYHSIVLKNIIFNGQFKLIWLKNINLFYFLTDYVFKGIKVKVFKIGSI